MSNSLIEAECLKEMSLEEVWHLSIGDASTFQEVVTIRLIDGNEVSMLKRQLSRVWYYMAFNRRYKVACTKDQFMHPGEWFTNKTHSRLLDAGLRVVDSEYKRNGKVLDLIEAGTLAVDISEQLVTDIPKYLDEYVATIDLEDYRQLANDPVISSLKKQVIKEVKESTTAQGKYQAIAKGYAGFEARQREEGDNLFKYNGASLLLNTLTLKPTQHRQGGFMRGFVTEINSVFFSDPTLNSYTDGVYTAWDMAKVTREGTKAAYYAGEPVQDTELGNRLHQIITAYLRAIVPGDCGTKSTYPVIVSKDNLAQLEGKNYYLDLSKGEMDWVRPGDTKLLGKLIHTRNIGGCINTTPGHRCAACFGQLSRSIPEGTLAGHALGVEVHAPISQGVISVKHDDTSKVGSGRVLTKDEAECIRIDSDDNALYIADAVDVNETFIQIDGREVEHIRDIDNVEDTKHLVLEYVTRVTAIRMDKPDKYGETQVNHVTVSSGNTPGYLSAEFLKYLKENPECWTEVPKNSYTIHTISLRGWDKSKPFIHLPLKHYNMLDFHSDLMGFLESKQKALEKLTDINTFGHAVQKFHELVIDRFKINFAIIESALYPMAFMLDGNGNKQLLSGNNECQFMTFNQAFTSYSVTTQLVTQNHTNIFKLPSNFIPKPIPPHPYDRHLLGRAVGDS